MQSQKTELHSTVAKIYFSKKIKTHIQARPAESFTTCKWLSSVHDSFWGIIFFTTGYKAQWNKHATPKLVGRVRFRPVTRFSGFGVQNILTGARFPFLLYVLINKFFWAQQNLGGTKNLGVLPPNAPPSLRAWLHFRPGHIEDYENCTCGLSSLVLIVKWVSTSRAEGGRFQ